MTVQSNLLRVLSVIVPLILFSCAGQVAPSGGDVDSTPPMIIRTEPDTNAVRVQTKEIVLEFSEYVDRRSVEESVFISPSIGEIEFDWSGREVTMTFSERLKANTTYVVNIGTDVRDIRASNRMASGYTLAFSTGDAIDQGKISGKVFDEKPEGVMMFAYVLDGMNTDTLDPSHTRPDYITQTGKDGTFKFSNIRFAAYRIIGVRDEFRNLLYDRQTDQFGVTTHDVQVNEKIPQAGELWFRLSSEDTTKPFLTKVIALSRSQVQLRFSEPLDTASFRATAIALTDTLGRNPVGVAVAVLERTDSLAARIIPASPLESGNVYKLSIAHVRDRVGNLIDSAKANVVFTAEGFLDTLRPTLEIVSIRDSIREVPFESTFEFRFSEPVEQRSVPPAVSLLDSAKRLLELDKRWISAMSLLISPRKPLNSASWYTIRVVMDSVRDLSGNGWKDSVSMLRFQTLDLKATGTIEGVVIDADSGTHLGEIYVTATRVLSSSPTVATLRLSGTGKFRFERLLEGRYTLSAFRDRDSSESFSFGKPFPFTPSERFAVIADTLKVRARWAVEGVVVRFKSSTAP
jgi:hypothetical protein